MVVLIGLAAAERAEAATLAETVEAAAAAMAAGMASAMCRRGWRWRRCGGDVAVAARVAVTVTTGAMAAAKVSKRVAVAKVAGPASVTTAAVM
jgi:hypothetical protein